MAKIKITPSLVALLRQVAETGSTSCDGIGQWSARNVAQKHDLIEPDRVEGYFLLYRLTAAGQEIIAKASKAATEQIMVDYHAARGDAPARRATKQEKRRTADALRAMRQQENPR